MCVHGQEDSTCTWIHWGQELAVTACPYKTIPCMDIAGGMWRVKFFLTSTNKCWKDQLFFLEQFCLFVQCCLTSDAIIYWNKTFSSFRQTLVGFCKALQKAPQSNNFPPLSPLLITKCGCSHLFTHRAAASTNEKMEGAALWLRVWTLEHVLGIQLCHLLSVWLWASYWICVGLCTVKWNLITEAILQYCLNRHRNCIWHMALAIVISCLKQCVTYHGTQYFKPW